MLLTQNALLRIGEVLKASALGIVGMAVEIREGFLAIYEPFAHVVDLQSFFHVVAGLGSLEITGLAVWPILLVVTLISFIARILKLFGTGPAGTPAPPSEFAVTTDPKPPRRRSRQPSGGDGVAVAPVTLPTPPPRKPRAKRETTPLAKAGKMADASGERGPTAEGGKGPGKRGDRVPTISLDGVSNSVRRPNRVPFGPGGRSRAEDAETTLPMLE